MTKRARVACKTVVENDDDDEGDNQDDNEAATTPDAGGNTDVEMGELVAAEDAYASTKVMGDQDQKISVLNVISCFACSILTCTRFVYPIET